MKLRQKKYFHYYKKYYCTQCHQFTIREHWDDFFECENDCEVIHKQIKHSIAKGNFNGFFEREEIDNHFVCSELDMFKLFPEPEIKFKTLSKNNSERLNNLFHRKNYTEVKIDDCIVKYLNKNNLCEPPNEMNNFGYMINLIEDIHYFLIRSCQELTLYDIALDVNQERESRTFYSARFFFNNSIEYCWYAYERIVVYLGLIFDYQFSEDLFKNKTFQILNYLKKNEKYKQSNFKDLLVKYNSDSKSFINERRQENTHSVSTHVSKLNTSLRKDEIERNKILNNNANYMDTKQLKPILYQNIQSVENLYCIFEHLIEALYEDTAQFENKTLPMLNEFYTQAEVKLESKTKIDMQYIDFLKKSVFIKFSKHIGKNIQPLIDIFFRLEEVQKCLNDTRNIFTGNFHSFWYQEIGVDLRPYFDDKCLVYAGQWRIYGCLDKFANYYEKKYDTNKIKYFADFKKLNEHLDEMVMEKIKKIIDSPAYAILESYRNQTAHNLRLGILYGENDIQIENYNILSALYELLLDCFDLLLLELNENSGL
ncbi:hypothetical protein ABE244_32040 [Bacillus toyonensis]|uniref:hypothetical protein n=1 Tax=Bacillus toyonensis TaxID=155322 RepID=UPI003D1A48CA